LYTWFNLIIARTYGIMAHGSMLLPMLPVSCFGLFFLWGLYWILKGIRKNEYINKSLLFLGSTYLFVLIYIQNYQTYLVKNHISLAVQGRYVFPVLQIVYILLVYYVNKIENKYLRIITYILWITLFILSCLPFFFYKVDVSWYR